MTNQIHHIRAEKAEKMDLQAIFDLLQATGSGLSITEAATRLNQFGPNTLQENKTPLWKKFLSYFWGPIPWMIEIALLLSLLLADWADTVLIALLLVVNGGIRFYEEYKADSAIALLKNKLAKQVQVLRDGHWQTLLATQLVPGDVVSVKLGDIIPADIKLITGSALAVDQSVLTGESLTVTKKIGEVAYAGSIVHRGEAQAVVIATAKHTYFGETAELMKEANTVSHFQRAVLNIGRFLIIMTLVLVAVLLTDAVYKHLPLLDVIKFLLLLTVAAIPVAMPAVLSVTMAVGASQLSKLKAIVSRLVAIEELAGMDVLCADKTGTLTQNKLTIAEPICFADADKDQVLQMAWIASNQNDPDMIEKTIAAQISDMAFMKKVQINNFVPFDPENKMASTTAIIAADNYKIVKGAPQQVISLTNQDHKRAYSIVDDYAARGYRTLAVAINKNNQGWELIGLMPMFDPPRADAKATIHEAQKLGVAVKMITGDHLAIAKETSRSLGLGNAVITADKLDEAFATEQFQHLSFDAVAQVLPKDKFAIVKTLQAKQHIVGMTGDGVNDAPALKQADVGIAVAEATDAARNAADLVLTADGIAVIVHAIQFARQIFQRMMSYAIYRIAETVRVLVFIALAILVFHVYPLTALMLIILALLNDLPIMMIAYDNTYTAQQPVRWHMPKVLFIASVLGGFGVISSCFLLWLGLHVFHLSTGQVQTLIFLKLTVSGHMTIYLARTSNKPFYTKPYPSLKLFLTSEITQIVGTLFAIFGWLMVPLGWKLGLLVWGYSFIEFVINDVFKLGSYRIYRYCHNRLHR